VVGDALDQPSGATQEHRDPVAGRTIRRWIVLLAASVVACIAVYLLAVWTVTGQTIENAALRGADSANPATAMDADTALGHITIVSLLVGTVVICSIGLLRRQPVLAFAAGAIIVGGQIVTQILKRFVLPRPDLVEVTAAYSHNSLPSGHTTIAMTVLFATMLVVPYRFRGIAMFVVLTWAVGIGAYTIVAKWHRVSDTLAADAIALGVASAVCLVLTRTGHLTVIPAGPNSSAAGHRYPLRGVFVAFLTALCAGMAAVAAILIIVTWNRSPIDDISEDNFFLGSHSLALSGSVLAALLFWWSLHRITLDGRIHKT
jgi:hypothetical protein